MHLLSAVMATVLLQFSIVTPLPLATIEPM